MNARREAERIRRACRASGRVAIEEAVNLLGMQIDGRRFRGVKLDEIAYRGNIAIGGHLSEPERRWAIAHAIGHRVLHTKGNQVWLRTCTQLSDKLEAQAEQFAYHLLVDVAEAWDEGLEAEEEIAVHFGVPVAMVRGGGRQGEWTSASTRFGKVKD